MKTNESGVLPESDIYFYSASPRAKDLYFYLIFHGHYFYSGSYSLSRLSYDSFLIINIQKGELFIDAGDGEQRVAQSETCLIDCYKPHKYWCKELCECRWFHFDGVLASSYFNYIKSLSGANIIQVNPNTLDRCFSEISGSRSISQAFFEASISKQICSVLHNAVANLLKSSPFTVGINDILDYIDEHLSEKIKISNLAKKLSISESHFNRLFKSQTGAAPYEYIKRAKLQYVKYLIDTTDKSISEISDLTGFGTSSRLIETFKSEYGTTPLKYRKMRR
jgi:AraC-like DNA-binding protein